MDISYSCNRILENGGKNKTLIDVYSLNDSTEFNETYLHQLNLFRRTSISWLCNCSTGFQNVFLASIVT